MVGLNTSLGSRPHRTIQRAHRSTGQRFTELAAASLQVTLGDFLRFLRATFNREPTAGFLRPGTLVLMQQLVPPATDYGLGFTFVTPGRRFAGHGGQNTGWCSTFYGSPETGDGLIVMTNSSNGNGVIFDVLVDFLFRASGRGPAPRRPLPIVLDVSIIESVTGRYESSDGAITEFRQEAGCLVWVLHEPFYVEWGAFPASETKFYPVAAGSVSFEFEFEGDNVATAVLVRDGDEESRAVRVHD